MVRTRELREGDGDGRATGVVREGLLQDLGVSETATAKEITKAYRKLARELHPDKNPGNTAAEERFKAVSAAYDVLGDETKRAEYDEVRRLGPMGGGGGPGGFTFNMDDANASGLGDLLGQMFGRAWRRGGGAASGVGPAARRRRPGRADARLRRRGARHDDDAAPDERRPVLDVRRLGRPARARRRSCARSAAAAASSTTTRACSRSPRRAAAAPGPGTVIEDPCPTCRGTGVEKRAREVQARIPAGVSDGQTIRLKGRGAPGRNGGPAGDLLVADPRRPAPPVRPQRQRPHGPRAGQLRRRRARRRRRRCRRSTVRR